MLEAQRGLVCLCSTSVWGFSEKSQQWRGRPSQPSLGMSFHLSVASPNGLSFVAASGSQTYYERAPKAGRGGDGGQHES